MGKSWLLQEIVWQLEHQYHKEVKALYIDVHAFVNLSQEAIPTLIIREALHLLGTKKELSDQSIDQLSKLLLESIASSPVSAFAFLFDHVSELDYQAYETLEQQLLRHLGVLTNVLLVFAGRNLPWVRSFDLRRRHRQITLLPFDIESTQKQIERQVPGASPISEYVQRLSNGHPWGNYLYAQSLTISFQPKNVEEAFVANSLNFANDRELRETLEALCVLRSIYVEIIPFMINVYFGDDSHPISDSEAAQILGNLKQAGIVDWSRTKRAWIMTEALRSELEYNLRTRRPTLYSRLIMAAYQHFCKMARLFPRDLEYWNQHTVIYAYKLELAGIEPPRCND
jgi:hypothetical protein